MIKIGDQLREAEKRQLETGKQNFFKHAKDNECRWSQGDYAVGHISPISSQTTDNRICETCEKTVKKDLIFECYKCVKKVCNRCTWFGYLTVKDKFLKGVLSEIQVCAPCKKSFDPPPPPPAIYGGNAYDYSKAYGYNYNNNYNNYNKANSNLDDEIQNQREAMWAMY